MRVNDILSDSNKWSKGSLARTKNGATISHVSPEAAKLCIRGAILKACGKNTLRAQAMEDLVLSVLPKRYSSVPQFNDAKETKFKDVQRIVGALGI